MRLKAADGATTNPASKRPGSTMWSVVSPWHCIAMITLKTLIDAAMAGDAGHISIGSTIPVVNSSGHKVLIGITSSKPPPFGALLRTATAQLKQPRFKG